MRLRTKLNLALLAAFSLGLVTAGTLTYWASRRAAEEHTLTEARIMVEGARAIRQYTVKEINPLLLPVMKGQFFPQTVAAHAAQSIFTTFRENFPEYSYREAALNPTNPANRASDWEADIIRTFRENPSVPEITLVREGPLGPLQVLALPIQINDAGCLSCHSTAKDAPTEMIDIYGTSNGFGWKMGDVVAAQIVSVPMTATLRRTTNVFMIFIGTLVAGFIVIGVMLNVFLNRFAIAPIIAISKMANDVSTGKKDAPIVEWASADEIGDLYLSFNRMRRSLDAALRLLR